MGIRMPDDAICQAILEKMDAPLISTRLFLFCFVLAVKNKGVFLCAFFRCFLFHVGASKEMGLTAVTLD